MRFLAIISVLLFSKLAYTQGGLGMTLLKDVHQSSYLNPANIQEGEDLKIGLPIVSNVMFEGSSSEFQISDFLYPNSDSNYLMIDPQAVYQEVNTKANFQLGASYDWLSLSKNLNENLNLNFAIVERINISGSLPYNLLNLAATGNAGSLVGDNIGFESLDAEFLWYREYRIGLATKISDKINFGGAVKYLQGISSFQTISNSLNLKTEEDFFDLSLRGDFSYSTSNMNMITADSGISIFSKTPFWSTNHGVGVDLGLSFKMNEKTDFSLSLLDFGTINWKNRTQNFESNFDTLSFSGLNLLELFSADSNVANLDAGSFNTDSVFNLLEIESSPSSYSTSLPFSILMSFNYQLSEKSSLSGVLRSRKFQSFWATAVQIAYLREVSESLTIGGSYSAGTNGIFNLGFMGTYDLGPVQVYLVSDNIIGSFLPQNIRFWSTRAGINLKL